jgi:hypothetical protein
LTWSVDYLKLLLSATDVRGIAIHPAMVYERGAPATSYNGSGIESVPVGVIASAMAQRAGLDLSPLIRAAEDWPRNWAGGREAKQSIGA